LLQGSQLAVSRHDHGRGSRTQGKELQHNPKDDLCNAYKKGFPIISLL